MNKEKQIEEMAKALATSTHSRCIGTSKTCGMCDWQAGCLYLGFAKTLVDKGYRKASEIFEEIDAHFDQRIALYQTMKSRALLVGNEVERKYADTMIINLTIYKKELAELKKKYTEEGE